MNKTTPKALILTGFGINCEEEMAAAYRLAGGAPTIVHLNEVLHGRVSIHDFDILNFPGGFSFGDDLGSGVVLANKLRYRQTGADGRTLLSDIREFVAAGKFVLGICNGFQVLVKLGLLPNLGGNFEPEVTLTHNASGRYEDRWVRLKVNPASRTPFLRGLTSFEVPVRHGEGRLVIPDAATQERLVALGLNCLAYADGDDQETGTYPLNPNGADLNCAGLCDPTGQIFGLMPHPEAFLAGCNHPDWGRRKRLGELKEEGDGLALFRNIVEHLRGGGPHPRPLPKREGSLTSAEDGGMMEMAEEPAHHYQTVQDHVFTTSAPQWKTLGGRARENRRQPTEAEARLWQELRGEKLGVQFRRQHAIDTYIVDFVCMRAKLIVEADGGIHTDPEQAEYDAGRTELLQEYGFQVIRFTNKEILEHTPQVISKIRQAIQPLTQQPHQTPQLPPPSRRAPLPFGEGPGVGSTHMNTLPHFATPQLQLLHRGKVRDSYRVDDATRLIVVSDRLSAFDSVLETAIPHKGAVLNGLANFWFEQTQGIIPNHVVKLVDANAMLVKEAQPIKVEMVVRNYLTGSMLRGYQQGQRTFSGVTVPDGLRKHQQFPAPIVTPTTKEESDREITPDNLVSEGWVSRELYDKMTEKSLALFKAGSDLLREKGIILVDTKYEFGLLNGELILIDEIHTPDSSRFWSADDYARNPEGAEQMDKEYIRQWLIANKVDDKYPRALTPEVTQEAVNRYLDIYQRIVGHPLPTADETGDVTERLTRNLVQAGLLSAS